MKMRDDEEPVCLTSEDRGLCRRTGPQSVVETVKRESSFPVEAVSMNFPREKVKSVRCDVDHC